MNLQFANHNPQLTTHNSQPTPNNSNSQHTTSNPQHPTSNYNTQHTMIFRTVIITFLIAAIFHISPAFCAKINFTPRASVEEEYTDNLFLTENNTKDDFVTTVSAGFVLDVAGRTGGLALSLDPNYEFYNQFDQFNEWGLLSDLKAWTSPSRATRFDLTNRFTRTTDPLGRDDYIAAVDGQVEEIGDTTLRTGRQPYYRNNARLNANHQFGREDRVYAGFLYGLLRNDDDQVEDNDEYRPSVGLDYWFTHRYGTQLFGEFTRGEFSHDNNFTGEPQGDFNNWLGQVRLLGRMTRHFSLFFQYDQVNRHFTSGRENDYLVYAPSAGFTYAISEDISLRLGLGYYRQVIENQKDHDDPFVNGEISKSWDFKRGFVNLTGLSGLTQNDFGAQNIGFQQFAAVQGSAGYDFTRKIAGDIGAYFRYAHTPAQSGPNAEGSQDTSQFHADAGIGYLLTRWMKGRLGYRFNTYNASGGGSDDYTENSVLLTITLQPEQPWRF